MKTLNFKVATLACIMVFGMSNCKNSPADKAQKVENAQEDLNTAEQNLQKSVLDSTNEYDRYKMDSEAKLKENDLKIAELKANLKSDKAEIRIKYENELTELEMKNSKLKTSIADYKETDKNKWEKFKTNFNHDLDELGQSISRMANKK